MIGLANKLNINVISEGIDDENIYKFFHSCGCTEYQGKLFMKDKAYGLINNLINGF